jgi:alpha-beta hydrolase superfamily lysophospholipase
MRTALAITSLLAAAIAAIATAVAWYYTAALHQRALLAGTSPDRKNLLIASVEEGLIGLRAIDGDDADLHCPGIFGLEWEGGRANVGPPLGERDGYVLRPFERLHGCGPTPGDMARLDSFVFGDDPAAAHGIEFREVTIAMPSGPAPAWIVDGPSATWAVAVHGKGASRREALRMLPALVQAGLPVLVPTYRNDPELAPPPGGRYGYGQLEWRDIEAAVAHARAAGAERIVMVGFSMGAAIVLAFLQRSPLATHVEALVLDAPMLSLRSVVERRAGDQGMPGPLIAYGRAVAARRFGLDWKATDYRAFARSLELPVLLFHGESDPTIAVEFSDELAAACRGRVTYVRVPGARHVRSWNVDPEGYRAAVAGFLGDLTPAR